MTTLWILLMSSMLISAEDKPPLTISTSRSWVIADDTPIGNLVNQVSTQTPGDNIVFGLEHSVGFNIIQSDPEPLPFVIDAKTGYVYTNQSLSTWGGKNIIMYVTAQYNNSSTPTSKYQVWVKIEKSSEKKNATVTNQNFLLTQVNFPGYKIPQSELPWKKPLTKLNNINDTWYLSSSSSTTSKFVLKPTTSDEVNLEPSAMPPLSSTEPNRSNYTKNVETTLTTVHETNGGKLIITFSFVSLALSGLFFAVTIYFFRKRMCRRKNKIKKDDMIKSSCGVLNSLDDPMILQPWQSVRVLGNRCDSWDSESQNQSTFSLNTATKMIDKWEIPRHHIKVFSILGEGCFGQVWKCETLNIDGKEGPTVVAVKMLKENASEQEKLDLAQELHVMKMLDPHPNVVRLLGCCTEKEPIFVVMEYVPNGKLQSYLRHSRSQRCYDNMHGSSNTLTSRDLTSFCYQIAKGMQYLSSKGIIHRDLAARNILVGENYVCKVADFGFARDIVSSHVYERKSEGRLPIRWMAPESLYYNVFSVKSDIWSFGILVWEIVTLGSTPYPGIPAAKVMSKVRDGYRLEKPEHCRRELYNIMYYCWDKDPNERPSFAELVDLLEQLLFSETDYILLEKFPEHSYYNMVSLSSEKI